MEIRVASVNDAEAIRRIYEPYVTKTAITFEYEVPSVEEFRERIKNTLEKYPYLVMEENGDIVGYAYAGTFYPRAAYSHSAELSVYVDMNHHNKGYGKSLYLKLEEFLLLQNVNMVHACIASPEEEDEYLTCDSENFHAHMGFEMAGRHIKCGYKFGRWYSVVWMDKVIKEKEENPEEFITFKDACYKYNL
ncbi:MAG: GNAT family N-acetyltransferase [Lachnospiraceae bacterium]|nr:GNAT family N-acetyltransferase [Lachnospiraceae bacterium]